MNIREMAEQREADYLSIYASLSREFQRKRAGRAALRYPAGLSERPGPDSSFSKAFRRLKHKTQVFLLPQGDHYRTRLDAHIWRWPRRPGRSRGLCGSTRTWRRPLPSATILAIRPSATPGEGALNEICPLGFAHYEQSVRVVELLEKKGEGPEPDLGGDGTGSGTTGQSGHPSTMEGKVVRLSDKIAYINHDIDDAERAGILSEAELPEAFCRALWATAPGNGSTR